MCPSFLIVSIYLRTAVRLVTCAEDRLRNDINVHGDSENEWAEAFLSYRLQLQNSADSDKVCYVMPGMNLQHRNVYAFSASPE